MTGDTKARRFFIFYGHGSNGKSKLLNILQKMVKITNISHQFFKIQTTACPDNEKFSKNFNKYINMDEVFSFLHSFFFDNLVCIYIVYIEPKYFMTFKII